jgi:hypothetical protein
MSGRYSSGEEAADDGTVAAALVAAVVYQRIMTAPAISRPKKIGNNIGGTSHSRRLNFWILDIRPPFFGGSAKLSVTDSSQGWAVMGAVDTLSVSKSREPQKNRLRTRRSRRRCWSTAGPAIAVARDQIKDRVADHPCHKLEDPCPL